MLASIGKSPPQKKAANYITAAFGDGRLPQRSKLHFEVVLELAPHSHAADARVVGEPVLVGGVRLARDQRLEVAAASLGDAEAVRPQILGWEFLLLVCDLGERHITDSPAVGARGLAQDRR